MFNEITEVPVAIRDFYQEVTKTEPKLDADGNQITEPKEVPSFDENGNEIMVTIQVPVFHDVVYVELKPKGEFKSLDDVWRVAERHKGKNDALIAKFLAMYSGSLQWQWHDETLAILLAPTILPTDLEIELPVRPAIIDSEGWFLRNYSRLRQCAYPSYNDQFEMQYDDVSSNVLSGQSAWRRCIDAVKAQYPKDTKD